MTADLLVVGLDLVTGREVHAGDRRTEEWRKKGHNGDRTLAGAQGFTARVEAWTPDGRRRSDVEVILPDGHRLAIELQRGELSDAEWIARHEDYARAGITDLWLYHPDTRVPRVVFRHRQPGWRFDLKTGTIGLIHAQPSPADAWTSPHPTQCLGGWSRGPYCARVVRAGASGIVRRYPQALS